MMNPLRTLFGRKQNNNQGKDSGKLIKGCATKARNGITKRSIGYIRV
jgi:hypothetical protein